MPEIPAPTMTTSKSVVAARPAVCGRTVLVVAMCCLLSESSRLPASGDRLGDPGVINLILGRRTGEDYGSTLSFALTLCAHAHDRVGVSGG
ncbi:hypothetical protein MKOR_39610 [Mycolicibacillus koreensis]|nr:hypothetical protein MKOR_39610 [Mycolicibacillus koreensis]